MSSGRGSQGLQHPPRRVPTRLQALERDDLEPLLSLQRCKPGRAPVYREGDRYHLDPHDAELDLWVFRLGLRPPKLARPAPPAPQDATLPSHDVALTSEELDEAWKDASLWSWSAQRLVLAVLDANKGPLPPAEIARLSEALH